MSAFKATWKGDGSPEAQIITEGNIRFIKGEPTEVPGDHPWAENIRANPVFDVEDVPEVSEDEIAALKATLAARGVKFRANIAPAKLRELVADTEDA